MTLRFAFALLGGLALVFLAPPLVLADAGALTPPAAMAGDKAAPAVNPCPVLGERVNLAETSQSECCKGHKGVCGCRAGKIVCCDGTASATCTCHGEDGFIE